MKLTKTIPYGRQNISESDISAVIEVLRSEFLTQGPAVPAFEVAVAKYCKVAHGVAVNSATSALHIACLALGLKARDWLWTSPITFVASANCGLYCGANVDFVDIDPATFNISPNALEKKLIEAQKLGRLPKILIVVHFGGQPCEMQAIHALSKKYGFSVVEDASHALGGKYQDESIGNCRFSDITIFSFHPVKIITTAEGGMAMTNDQLVAQKMVQLRSHGITRNTDDMTHSSDGPWFYQQIELGFNYRMTELQAALGLSQLKRLDSFVASRHKLAKRYSKLLEQFPIVKQLQIKGSYTSFHLYAIRLQLNKINKSQLEIFNELLEEGIGVNLHYIPVHTHPYYKNLGFKKGDFIEAENYYEEALSIPIFQDMTELQQDEVCAALKKVLTT